MAFLMDKEYIEKTYDGKIFSQDSESKDALFLLEGDCYNFTIKDENDDIEISDKNVLGDSDIDLDDLMPIKKEEINFKRVTKICTGAFENLKCSADKIFSFESEEVKIEPKAFGLGFQGLKEIKGLGSKLSLVLYDDSFNNEDVLKEIEKFENIDLYLDGKEWTKDTIGHLIKAEFDGKIRIREGFGMSNGEGRFTEDELKADIDKLSKEFAQKISLDKKAIKEAKATRSKAKKEEKDAKRAKGESVPVGWKNLEDGVKEEILKEIFKEFTNNDIYARIKLKEGLNVTEAGEIKIVKDSIDKVSFMGSTVKVMEQVFNTVYADKDGKNIELKKNKENKDKARMVAKERIKECFNDVILKEDLKGPGGIICKFVIDTDELNKLKGKDVKLGENIVSVNKDNFLDIDSVKDVFDEVNELKTETKRTDSGKIPMSEDLYKRTLMSIQLVAKYYKNKKGYEDVYSQCLRSARVLKEGKIKE